LSKCRARGPKQGEPNKPVRKKRKEDQLFCIRGKRGGKQGRRLTKKEEKGKRGTRLAKKEKGRKKME